MPRGRQRKAAAKNNEAHPEPAANKKTANRNSAKANKNGIAKEERNSKVKRSNHSKVKTPGRKKQGEELKVEIKNLNEEIRSSGESDFDMESSPGVRIKEEDNLKTTAKGKRRNNKGKVNLECAQNAKSTQVSSKTKRNKDAVEDVVEKPTKKQKVRKNRKTEASESIEEDNFPPTKKQNPGKARKIQTSESFDNGNAPVNKRNTRKSQKTQAIESIIKSHAPAKKQKVGKEGETQASESIDKDCILDSKPDLKDLVAKVEVKKEEANKEDGKWKADATIDTTDALGEGHKEDEDEDKVEEMSSDGSSESEWEEVEDLPLDEIDPATTSAAADIAGPSGTDKPKEPVEISIEVSNGSTLRSKKKQKYEEMWRRYLQWQVNKFNKDLQETLHKVHLLCLIASGLQSSTLCNDMELQCIALSHIPTSMMPRSKSRADTSYLQKFVKWFRSSFETDVELKDDPSHPMKMKLTQRLETRRVATENELVHVCVLLLRALGLDVRLVLSLHPITIKSIKLTKANKRLSKSKTGKSLSGPSKASSKDTSKKVPHSKTKPVCSKFFQSPGDKSSGSSKSKQTSKTDSNTSSSQNMKKNITTQGKKTKGKDEKHTQDGKPVAHSESSQARGPRPKNRQQRKCASKVKPIIELSSEESEASSEEYQMLESDSDSDYEESSTEKTPSAKKRKHNSTVSRKRTKKQSDSDSEEAERIIESSRKKRQKSGARSKKSKQLRKKSAGNSSVEEVESDSDFEVEVIRVASGPRKTSSSGEGSAKKSRKVVSSDSDESVEIIKTKGDLDKQGTDQWLEVYCAADNTWICVDCIHGGNVKRPDQCERFASKPITYVLAFDNEGSMKDITQRYDSKWMIGTQKLRVESEWWQETLQPFRSRNKTRDRQEDDQLQRKLLDKPLPTTVSEYKNHPLYALKRHLLKFEAIYPETAAILGYCRGEAVYARECVHELHTRQTWLKEARVVRIGEKAYKMVKARPKRKQPMETEPSLEVYGHWQTEEYIPPLAVDGIVPRNEHGNVELFKECMLPKGTVHMRLVGLNRIARKLDIDCAPAMTGWDFHSGFCHPVLDGYVVCEEYEDLLTDAWHKEQQEIEKKKRKKMEDRALKNWKLLIKGVLIRERLNKRFQTDEGASTSSPSKHKDKKSEKVSWPKNRMTSFEGDKSSLEWTYSKKIDSNNFWPPQHVVEGLCDHAEGCLGGCLSGCLHGWKKIH